MQDSNQTYKRFMNLSEACLYLGLGRNKTMEFCKEINAKRKIGRRVLYDKIVIDEYFDKKNQGEDVE